MSIKILLQFDFFLFFFFSCPEILNFIFSQYPSVLQTISVCLVITFGMYILYVCDAEMGWSYCLKKVHYYIITIFYSIKIKYKNGNIMLLKNKGELSHGSSLSKENVSTLPISVILTCAFTGFKVVAPN